MSSLFVFLMLLAASSVKGQMSCIEAQSQLSEGAGETCNDILTSGSIFNMDDSKITTFCEDNDCPKTLLDIYDSITKACGKGAPSGGNDPFYYLLKEACWKYNETDCVTLWKLYIYPLQTGVNTTISDSYNLCLQEYSRSRSNCTDTCKSVLDEFIQDMGCCYDAIENIGFPYIGSDMVRACQVTVPTCATRSNN